MTGRIVGWNNPAVRVPCPSPGDCRFTQHWVRTAGPPEPIYAKETP